MYFDATANIYIHPTYGTISHDKLLRVFNDESNKIRPHETPGAELNIKIFVNTYLRNEVKPDYGYFNLIRSIGDVIRNDASYKQVKTAVSVLMVLFPKCSIELTGLILNGDNVIKINTPECLFLHTCYEGFIHATKGIKTSLFQMMLMLGLNVLNDYFIFIIGARLLSPDLNPLKYCLYEELVFYALQNGFSISAIERMSSESHFSCREKFSYPLLHILHDYIYFKKENGRIRTLLGFGYVGCQCYVEYNDRLRLCSGCFMIAILVKIENSFTFKKSLLQLLLETTTI